MTSIPRKKTPETEDAVEVEVADAMRQIVPVAEEPMVVAGVAVVRRKPGRKHHKDVLVPFFKRSHSPAGGSIESGMKTKRKLRE